FLFKIQPAIRYSLPGRYDSVLAEQIHFSNLLAPENLLSVKVLHFTGERGLEFGSIKMRNMIGSTYSIAKSVSVFLDGIPNGCNGPDPSNDNSSHVKKLFAYII